MRPPPLPDNEELRLKNLLSYDILDTPEEKDFDELLQLAAQICCCSKAMITFVDKDRQWFKAKKNITEKETIRQISFCAHAILKKEEVMVVNNAQNDARFFNYPNVTGGLKIAFYAGAPIISEAGYALGTVCVIDQQEKHLFTPLQQQALKIIAGQVSKLLELKIKNKLLVEKSNLLLNAEKQITQFNLTTHDKEKGLIAYELHENFAQTLAAIKFYIETAEQSSELSKHFLQKSKENITALIKEVKTFTKTIVPTTLENDNYFTIIQELVHQFGKINTINIELVCNKYFDGFESNIGFAIFRIVENQLKIAHNAHAKNITIEIKKEKNLSILFTDDGTVVKIAARENDILFNNTITRTGILKGKLLTGKKASGKNFTELKIPLSSF